MDNGQRLQNGNKLSDDALFADGLTEGVGTKPDISNPDIAESLHSDDQSISWQRGNKIISFPGDSLQGAESLRDQKQPNVTNLTMPPILDAHIVKEQPDGREALKSASVSDRANFKIIGDKVNAAVIKKAEAMEREKIWENDDAAGYNDAIRDEHSGVTVTLLDNSFGPNSAWERSEEKEATNTSKIIDLSDYGSFGRDSTYKEAA